MCSSDLLLPGSKSFTKHGRDGGVPGVSSATEKRSPRRAKPCRKRKCTRESISGILKKKKNHEMHVFRNISHCARKRILLRITKREKNQEVSSGRFLRSEPTSLHENGHQHRQKIWEGPLQKPFQKDHPRSLQNVPISICPGSRHRRYALPKEQDLGFPSPPRRTSFDLEGRRTFDPGELAMKYILIRLIRFYKLFISPCLPPACRFYPTCSVYFMEALEKKGLVKGFLMGVYRILRCNPFCKGGYDPVDQEEERAPDRDHEIHHKNGGA